MIRTLGLKQSDIDNIISVLKKEPGIDKAIVFGSRAKQNHRDGSDVDLALSGSNLSRNTITRVSFLLNEETNMPYKFDVVNHNSIQSKDLLQHIDRVGKLIYSKIF